MTEKILFVDDDETILRSFKRTLAFDFNIDTAVGGDLGLELMRKNGPFAIVVSDMRMPGMDGSRFLCQVREQWPDSVRILLTGQADMNDAIEVVNEGHIFRFLTKPCPPEKLSNALNDGLEQYRLLKSEQELLNKTLKGIIKLLIDKMSTVNPRAFSRSVRVRKTANMIGARLNMDNLWQIDIAALLSQIGSLTIPGDILTKKNIGHSVSQSEEQLFTDRLRIGRDLLVNIPRLEAVAEAIAYQEKKFNGGGLPKDNIRGKQIPMMARILIVVHDYDGLLKAGKTKDQAIEEMYQHGAWYDPDILAVLESVEILGEEFVIKEISASEIEIGMVLADDVLSKGRKLLATKRQEISSSLRIYIINFARKEDIIEPLKILDCIKEEEGELV